MDNHFTKSGNIDRKRSAVVEDLCTLCVQRAKVVLKRTIAPSASVENGPAMQSIFDNMASTATYPRTNELL